MFPQCPEGYKAVSNGAFRPVSYVIDKVTKYKNGSVHCLADRYVLTKEQAAKYGYDGSVERGEVQKTSGNSPTTNYYPTTLKTFEYISKDAIFDLGMTGSVYYPTFFRQGNANFEPVLIDFGHEDFYFTEDTRKTFADLDQ